MMWPQQGPAYQGGPPCRWLPDRLAEGIPNTCCIMFPQATYQKPNQFHLNISRTISVFWFHPHVRFQLVQALSPQAGSIIRFPITGPTCPGLYGFHPPALEAFGPPPKPFGVCPRIPCGASWSHEPWSLRIVWGTWKNHGKTMGKPKATISGCLSMAHVHRFSDHKMAIIWQLKNGNMMMNLWCLILSQPFWDSHQTWEELEENSLEQHLAEYCLRVFLVFCSSIKSDGLTGLTPTHGQCGPVRD